MSKKRPRAKSNKRTKVRIIIYKKGKPKRKAARKKTVKSSKKGKKASPVKRRKGAPDVVGSITGRVEHLKDELDSLSEELDEAFEPGPAVDPPDQWPEK